MEIKHRLDMIIATNRRFVIRRSKSAEPNFCAECGGATLTAEQTAAFFGINQRVIFQFIENGAAHFAEIQTGAVIICLPALAAILDGENEIKEETNNTNGIG